MHGRFWIAIVFAMCGLTSGGCKVSKEHWIEKFEPATIDALCKPEMYFRKCFEIDEAGCRSLASKTIRACLDKERSTIPDTLDENDGRRIGGEVGRCAGTAYYEELAKANKLLTTAKCQDASAWLPK